MLDLALMYFSSAVQVALVTSNIFKLQNFIRGNRTNSHKKKKSFRKIDGRKVL